MMFLNNKYSRWYFALIEKAKTSIHEGYVEKHHIIPKSLGGKNTKDNIVKLTAREHFVCHLLLTKAVLEEYTVPMKHALFRMTTGKHVIWSSGQYEIARKLHAQAVSKRMKGRLISDETCKKMSQSLMGRAGVVRKKPYSKEEKEMQEARGKSVGKTNIGKTYSVEHRQKISEARKKYWEEYHVSNH